MDDNAHTVNVPFKDYAKMKEALEGLAAREEIIKAHFDLYNDALGVGTDNIDLTKMPISANHQAHNYDHNARNGKIYFNYKEQ